jgi:signal transduction histidine kinase/HPt (histidine-containing phosphotransfer) domain-containing protein
MPVNEINTDSATILLVDDEPNILRALDRLLHKDKYRILTAACGKEAVAVVEQNSVDLIISDLRMPGMSGTEFLQIAAEIEPAVPRILLSGQRDLDLAIRAVNEGQISQYIEKPWDPHALRVTIQQMVEKRFTDLHSQQLAGKIADQNTVLTRLNEELNEKTLEAESQNRLKSRFLAMMSHEIRTPITGILGVLEALKDTALNAEQRDLVTTGINSSLHLKRIVDDSLDLSKLEAGQMSIETIVFSPSDLIENAIQLFKPKFKAKGLSLKAKGHHVLPQFIKGDPYRIRQILLNLISNGWKFTENGGVTIRVTYSDGQMHICVEDTGTGIPETGKSRLFKEFCMLDNANSSLQEGTGLGLAISQKLTELMDGQLAHADNPSGGSRFTLTLPCRESQPALLEPEAVEISMPLSNLKVLLVDDNATNLKVIGLLLKNLGHHVTTANHGADAIDLVNHHSSGQPFDLVFMDISMPVMDGLEATRCLRKIFSSEQLPIIAMTAHVEKEDEQRFLEAGINDVILKPLQKRDLADSISKLTCQPCAEKQTIIQITNADQLIDKSVLSTLIADIGLEVFPNLADSFISDSLTRLANIRKYSQQGDQENLIHETHTLGSSAGMFGATKLQSMCYQMESRWKSGLPISSEQCEALINTVEVSIDAFLRLHSASDQPDHLIA